MCRVTSADLMSSCMPGGLVSASEVERYVADLRLRVEPVRRVLERLCWAQDMTPSTARFAIGGRWWRVVDDVAFGASPRGLPTGNGWG